MFIDSRLDLFLLVVLLCTLQGSASQNSLPTWPGDRIYLDVVVTPTSGPPVSGLHQQDFTLLDNNVPQIITSFEAVDGRHEPVEVVLVLDAVNVGSREVAIEREEIKRFLRAEGGLVGPTRVAVLTDKGLQFQEDFTPDGNAISRALDHNTIRLRSIGPNADRGGAADRFQIAFQGFAQLIAQERERPGRKMILWLSPGWPLGSGGIGGGAKREQQIFGNTVEISKQLREGQITIYSVDPSAIGDIDPGLTDVGRPTYHLRASDRTTNSEGTGEPSEVRWGDLALEIFATQSGGLALHPGNDIASALHKCLADAEAYYEITFDSASTDRPGKYHHLEIRIAKPGLTARTRQAYFSQDDTLSSKPNTENAPVADASDEVHQANPRPYLDLSLPQLVERIPELKSLKPAPDQQQLPVILQNVGRTVDDFVRDIGDLIAREEVTQEKLNAAGKIKAKERVQDNYLILHHGYQWGASAEYRMDDKGNRLGPIGLEKGYLVTSGYALSCISFSSVAQSQSKFRYLGEEKIESRETYVLGFAQQPGEATFFSTMRGTGGADVDMLTQGILWVDENNFQIIRMRSDLLAPRNEIQLEQLTTEVKFGEVRFEDVPNPLWLPTQVDVYIEIDKQKYRNLHHYTEYRRYRVTAKIGTSQ
jgi:VWFA-related protein